VTEHRTAIIIPAHNEESVIARTLTTLLQDAGPGEFDTTVVCNGCNDRTAEYIRRDFSSVNVIELNEASKTAAINAGLDSARDSNVLLLDADIEISTAAVRLLISAVAAPEIDAAIGRMRIDDERSSRSVRAFYRVWAKHPYLRNGKFAAAIAISRDAIDRIGALPSVIADDTYLKRVISNSRTAVVDGVSFRVRVPRSLTALIRVRSRIYRGNRQLDGILPRQESSATNQNRLLLQTVISKPALWPDFLCYVSIGIAARVVALLASDTWQRDLTTREAVT
jgi:glycosyltransferase involved in cell wall biosynthesis